MLRTKWSLKARDIDVFVLRRLYSGLFSTSAPLRFLHFFFLSFEIPYPDNSSLFSHLVTIYF